MTASPPPPSAAQIPAGAPGDPLKPRFNPRIIALLAVLIAVIFTSVIVTDYLSPRDRHPAATSTATFSAPATGGTP